VCAGVKAELRPLYPEEIGRVLLQRDGIVRAGVNLDEVGVGVLCRGTAEKIYLGDAVVVQVEVVLTDSDGYGLRLVAGAVGDGYVLAFGQCAAAVYGKWREIGLAGSGFGLNPDLADVVGLGEDEPLLADVIVVGLLYGGAASLNELLCMPARRLLFEFIIP
jgi:hypothetical protein